MRCAKEVQEATGGERKASSYTVKNGLVELRWISLRLYSSCYMIGESPFAYSKADVLS